MLLRLTMVFHRHGGVTIPRWTRNRHQHQVDESFSRFLEEKFLVGEQYFGIKLSYFCITDTCWSDKPPDDKYSETIQLSGALNPVKVLYCDSIATSSRCDRWDESIRDLFLQCLTWLNCDEFNFKNQLQVLLKRWKNIFWSMKSSFSVSLSQDCVVETSIWGIGP